MKKLGVGVLVVLFVAAACGGGTKLTVLEEKLESTVVGGVTVNGVHGIVRNDGSGVVRNVVAIVEWLDADGKQLAGAADPTKPAEIAAGATATFAVLAPPGETRVRKYRLKFESK